MVNNLTPADYGIENYEEVTLITEDNLRLRAWYVAPNREDGTTIIFLHGHGGHINDLIPDTNMGYGALLFDFRGHGASDDTVVTMGINEVMDVQAGINFLLDQSAVNPERIALYGNSMGASVALLSAQQIPEIRVVIADAPSDNADEVAAVTVPPLGSKAGRNFCICSIVASGRITSSTVHSCKRPAAS